MASSERVWLLDIEALDGQGSPTILRYSNAEYSGENYYEPRLKQPGLFQEGLFSNNILPAQRSSVGVSKLINVDGFLNFLVDYAIDGRSITLSFFDGETVQEAFTGTCERFDFSRTEVSVVMRAPSDILNVSRNFTEYLGTNIAPDGLEGTENDLKGNPKPRLYGEGRNITPILVNSQKLIYQVSDINCTILSVRDNGVELEFDGTYNSLTELETLPPDENDWEDWMPPAGTYRRYEGYVRLGVEPSGQLTVDADGPNTLLGDVFEYVSNEAGVVLSSGKAELNTFGNCRLLATQEENYIQLLDRLALSAGCYWRRRSDGDLEVGLVPTPDENNISLFIEDYMIIDMNRSASGGGSNGLPIYRVEVQADRIESVQKDLSGSADAELRARVASQYRKANAQDLSVQSRHPLSTEFTLSSDLSSLSSAQNVADNILSLLSPRRDVVSVQINLSRDNLSLPLLSTVRLQTIRLGYDNGRDMLVVEKTFNPVKNKLSLLLWG